MLHLKRLKIQGMDEINLYCYNQLEMFKKDFHERKINILQVQNGILS